MTSGLLTGAEANKITKEPFVIYLSGVDTRGELTDVERPGGVVPDGLIPQPILKFVAANYPGRHVRGVERDGRNHEITLDNGLELKFNRRFRLVETDH